MFPEPPRIELLAGDQAFQGRGSGEDFVFRPWKESMLFCHTHEVSDCVPPCVSPVRSCLSMGIKVTEPADPMWKASKPQPKEPFLFAGVPPSVCVTVIDGCLPSLTHPCWFWCPLLSVPIRSHGNQQNRGCHLLHCKLTHRAASWHAHLQACKRWLRAGSSGVTNALAMTGRSVLGSGVCSGHVWSEN